MTRTVDDALAIAREHIRWAYRHGLSRCEIAQSIGLTRWRGDARKDSLLVPVAAAWISLTGGCHENHLDRT